MWVALLCFVITTCVSGKVQNFGDPLTEFNDGFEENAPGSATNHMAGQLLTYLNEGRSHANPARHKQPLAAISVGDIGALVEHVAVASKTNSDHKGGTHTSKTTQKFSLLHKHKRRKHDRSLEPYLPEVVATRKNSQGLGAMEPPVPDFIRKERHSRLSWIIPGIVTVLHQIVVVLKEAHGEHLDRDLMDRSHAQKHQILWVCQDTIRGFFPHQLCDILADSYMIQFGRDHFLSDDNISKVSELLAVSLIKDMAVNYKRVAMFYWRVEMDNSIHFHSRPF